MNSYMSCIIINKGIICLSNVTFTCPQCKKEYNDTNDKYLDRCNTNKSGYIKIKCECKNIFGMTYNIRSNAVGFELNN